MIDSNKDKECERNSDVIIQMKKDLNEILNQVNFDDEDKLIRSYIMELLEKNS